LRGKKEFMGKIMYMIGVFFCMQRGKSYSLRKWRRYRLKFVLKSWQYSQLWETRHTLSFRGSTEIPICLTRDDKSLTLPTFRCNLFDGQNISFDASLVIYIYIHIYIYTILIFLQLWLKIMVKNKIYETQNLLSL
jgi:hypothetical protein